MERSTSGYSSQGMEQVNNNERFKIGCEYLVHIYKKETISGWQCDEIYEHAGWNALLVGSLSIISITLDRRILSYLNYY